LFVAGCLLLLSLSLALMLIQCPLLALLTKLADCLIVLLLQSAALTLLPVLFLDVSLISANARAREGELGQCDHRPKPEDHRNRDGDRNPAGRDHERRFPDRPIGTRSR
jgi:hypothetical protein